MIMVMSKSMNKMTKNKIKNESCTVGAKLG
jgi:hypothetical protein